MPSQAPFWGCRVGDIILANDTFMAIDDITAPIDPEPQPGTAGEPALEEPGDLGIARLDALHGRRLVLTEERVTVDGDDDGWGGWSVAFLSQIAAVRVSPGRKERSSLIWGVIGIFAAIGVWQVASNDAVSTVGGLVVGAISLALLGEFFLRPPDLNMQIILGTETIDVDIKRSQAEEARQFADLILETRSRVLTAAPPVNWGNGAGPAIQVPRFPLP